MYVAMDAVPAPLLNPVWVPPGWPEAEAMTVWSKENATELGSAEAGDQAADTHNTHADASKWYFFISGAPRLSLTSSNLRANAQNSCESMLPGSASLEL